MDALSKIAPRELRGAGPVTEMRTSAAIFFRILRAKLAFPYKGRSDARTRRITRRGMKLTAVGFNPADCWTRAGHYYAGRGNPFLATALRFRHPARIAEGGFRVASFTQSFAKLGLFPDFGGTCIRRLAGPAVATEFVMIGAETVSAADALRMGLVSRVLPIGWKRKPRWSRIAWPRRRRLWPEA